MMPSIGAYSFVTFRGSINPLAEEIEIITRPGVDGVAAKQMGKRAQAATILTEVDVLDAAALTTLVAGYRAIRGSLVTVVDGAGRTHTNILVADVRHVRTQGITAHAGGLVADSTLLVGAEWVLQATEIPT